VGLPLAFVLMACSEEWRSFWTLFGTSNQLLAALSLLGICVWLKKSGRRYAYALPMVFVAAVTLVSLVMQIRKDFLVTGAKPVVQVNGGVCVVLPVLALSFFTAVGRWCSRGIARDPPGCVRARR
jgi:carbon starvation protein